MNSRRKDWYIRRARPEDARAIHDVHMRSIREVCSRDHTLAEVMAWGGRPYDEAARVKTINENFVWVIQRAGVRPPSEVAIEKLHDESVAGFAVMALRPFVLTERGEKADEPVQTECQAHIFALYFGSEILGLGFGRELVEIMLSEARNAGAKRITLESTLTAHEFYKRCGFIDSGPQTTVEINGERIRCFPMFRALNEVVPIDL